jgi:hypothetical protein
MFYGPVYRRPPLRALGFKGVHSTGLEIIKRSGSKEKLM